MANNCSSNSIDTEIESKEESIDASRSKKWKPYERRLIKWAIRKKVANSISPLGASGLDKKNDDKKHNFEFKRTIKDLQQNHIYKIECEMYFPFWNLSFWSVDGPKRPKPRVLFKKHGFNFIQIVATTSESMFQDAKQEIVNENIIDLATKLDLLQRKKTKKKKHNHKQLSLSKGKSYEAFTNSPHRGLQKHGHPHNPFGHKTPHHQKKDKKKEKTKKSKSKEKNDKTENDENDHNDENEIEKGKEKDGDGTLIEKRISMTRSLRVCLSLFRFFLL